MKKSQFMIMDYPGLVKYFASPNPLFLLFFVIPLFSFFLYFTLQSVMNPFLIVAGIFYWTLLEYLIHRFIYHTHFSNKIFYYFFGSFHLYHHKNMADHRILNAGFIMVFILAPFFVSPVLLITRDSGVWGSVGLGLTIGYYFYECVHYILHYKVYEKGYLNYIQKYHLYHHDRGPQKNFGNTSHFWDMIFGTYDARYRDYEIPESTRKTFITQKKVTFSHVEARS